MPISVSYLEKHLKENVVPYNQSLYAKLAMDALYLLSQARIEEFYPPRPVINELNADLLQLELNILFNDIIESKDSTIKALWTLNRTDSFFEIIVLCIIRMENPEYLPYRKMPLPKKPLPREYDEDDAFMLIQIAKSFGMRVVKLPVFENDYSTFEFDPLNDSKQAQRVAEKFKINVIAKNDHVFAGIGGLEGLAVAVPYGNIPHRLIENRAICKAAYQYLQHKSTSHKE